MKKIISGKVRDVFELSDSELVIVTTDRISAFDVILPSLIKNKGVYLNKISNFWFDYAKDIVPNHLISADIDDMPDLFRNDRAQYEGRTILVKKLKMMPFEFIVRGYMFGSMWSAYQKGEKFCGLELKGNYRLAEKLAAPILTPSEKAESGHDRYISMTELENSLGKETTEKIAALCLELYNTCAAYALTRGIIMADTKFEFGFDKDGRIVLADEIFTPDSSRFWDASGYRTGESPSSYDKQYVRDWLIKNKLDGVSPGKELPQEIIDVTSDLYKKCYEKLTGK